MRITMGVKVTLLAATAGLLLTACSTDSDTEATASTGTDTAAEATTEAPNVSQILDDVRTATACETWTGGKVAGDGVLAGWEYSCDADEDGVVDHTLAVYTSEDARQTDLANVKAAHTDSGIIETDEYIFTTTSADALNAVSELGGDIVTELGA